MNISHPHHHWITTLSFLAMMGWQVSSFSFEANREAEDPFHGGFQDGEYARGIQLPPKLTGKLTNNGKHLLDGAPVRAVILDPVLTTQFNENTQPSTAAAAATVNNLAASASFTFSYYSQGAIDPWGAVCQTTPTEAKGAFTGAGNIWAQKIKSTVPITIQVCWSNLGTVNILGYSGTRDTFMNFSGAPKSNVWYQSSLANALFGTDLNGAKPDMYITFNTNFAWYYGTDGNPPWNQMDLLTVALHEIGHGLNFAGTMEYSNGLGAWGYSTGYPSIYDTFTENGAGNKLISYTNPSTGRSSVSSGN
jgi:hypothetical protein